MSEREELADILMSDTVMRTSAMGRDYALVEADAVLAAGFRKVTEAVEGVRTITTYAELRALKDGTVIRVFGDDDWEVYAKTGEDRWHAVGDDLGSSSVSITLPAAVLYSPGATA